MSPAAATFTQVVMPPGQAPPAVGVAEHAGRAER